MPIGNLTSQLFANLYLDPLDHFVKEQLRQRCYIRYMDDFVILAQAKSELWEILGKIKNFLAVHLQLQLNPKRVAVLPIERGIDFLGYMIFPDGYKRIRRRNVVKFPAQVEDTGEEACADRDNLRSRPPIHRGWLGLAKHASAFRLSRSLIMEHDVRNIGKRLLVKMTER